MQTNKFPNFNQKSLLRKPPHLLLNSPHITGTEFFSSVSKKINAKQEKIQKYQSLLTESIHSNNDSHIPPSLMMKTVGLNLSDLKQNLPDLSQNSSQYSIFIKNNLKKRFEFY